MNISITEKDQVYRKVNRRLFFICLFIGILFLSFIAPFRCKTFIDFVIYFASSLIFSLICGFVPLIRSIVGLKLKNARTISVIDGEVIIYKGTKIIKKIDLSKEIKITAKKDAFFFFISGNFSLYFKSGVFSLPYYCRLDYYAQDDIYPLLRALGIS